MTCKICGKKLPDGSTVCKYCGTELRRPQSNSKRYSKKGKARKRAMDAVVLLLALLVIAGVIAAIAWSSEKAAGETEEPAAVAEETQTT
ncbi:MAG: zinc ribbon domain-containing protein, partial [Oscillospiraceae bacterium]|nr:zinc ribbon domain-containing protein [Oscillospiraceae bacterium]